MDFMKTISEEDMDDPGFISTKEKATHPSPGVNKATKGRARSKTTGVPRFDDIVPPRTDQRLASFVEPVNPLIGRKWLRYARFVVLQHTMDAYEEFDNVSGPWLCAENIPRGRRVAMMLDVSEFTTLKGLICLWGIYR